jgi:hypothetical protein
MTPDTPTNITEAEGWSCERCGSDDLSPHLLKHRHDSIGYHGRQRMSGACGASWGSDYRICRECWDDLKSWFDGGKKFRKLRDRRAMARWQEEARRAAR